MSDEAKKPKMKDGIMRRGTKWYVAVPTGEKTPAGHPALATATCETLDDAKAKRDEFRQQIRENRYVAPTHYTVGGWLDEWLKNIVQPTLAPRTYATYERVIRVDLKPVIGATMLPKLKPADLTRLYAEHAKTHAASTTWRLHNIMSTALKSAVKQQLVVRSVATKMLVDGLPKLVTPEMPCWPEDVISRFLRLTEQRTPQEAALYALAFDTGMRRNELLALDWERVDLERGTVKVNRQLRTWGRTPEFMPPKRGSKRLIDSLAPQTVALLRKHHDAQRELFMANRTTYRGPDGAVIRTKDDYDNIALVFGKTEDDLSNHPDDALGLPLRPDEVSRQFDLLVASAKLKPRISFHGIRHSAATLWLTKKVPLHIVSKRLGHKNATVTLQAYTHVLTGDQQAVADVVSTALYR